MFSVLEPKLRKLLGTCSELFIIFGEQLVSHAGTRDKPKNVCSEQSDLPEICGFSHPSRLFKLRVTQLTLGLRIEPEGYATNFRATQLTLGILI